MFESFFDKIKKEEILLFTTFTLDEAVLVALLEKHKVNKNQRIVVYHDILRHRNPGYLQAHYKNSTVISVILKNPDKNRCPVFHTKIWARILKTNNTFNLKKIAVTSANLSSYHLVKSEGYGTFESFVLFNNLNSELPDSFLFEKDNIFTVQ